MPDDMTVNVPGSGELLPEAWGALHRATEAYAASLLVEARRIEQARRVTPGQAIITDTTIQVVEMNARNGQMVRPESKSAALLKIGEYGFTAGAGGFAGYISHPVGAIGFAVCVIAGVLANIGGRRRA